MSVVEGDVAAAPATSVQASVVGTSVHGVAPPLLGPAYLSAQALTKAYGHGARQVTVVRNVGFEIAKAEFVCVLGPSGCGKTTLLRLIAGFERADGGVIVQDGRDITALTPEGRDFGIVFQSYALFPNRTVEGNVAYGLEAIGTPGGARRERVRELLTLVGLSDHAAKYPSQLSGGQQQRVALARALALSPGLLLLDEPLSALDANVRANLRDELRALQRRVGVTTLMVTHDQQEALSIADRIIVMNAGRIEQSGPPAAVYDRPANLFVARFLGEMNALPVASLAGGVAQVGGHAFVLNETTQLPAGNASFCIRPGAVAVGRDALDQSNRITGRVTTVAFRGDAVRMTIALPGPGDLVIEADTPRARMSEMPVVSDSLHVALPPRHCLLLAGEA